MKTKIKIRYQLPKKLVNSTKIKLANNQLNRMIKTLERIANERN